MKNLYYLIAFFVLTVSLASCLKKAKQELAEQAPIIIHDTLVVYEDTVEDQQDELIQPNKLDQPKELAQQSNVAQPNKVEPAKGVEVKEVSREVKNVKKEVPHVETARPQTTQAQVVRPQATRSQVARPGDGQSLKRYSVIVATLSSQGSIDALRHFFDRDGISYFVTKNAAGRSYFVLHTSDSEQEAIQARANFLLSTVVNKTREEIWRKYYIQLTDTFILEKR